MYHTKSILEGVCIIQNQVYKFCPYHLGSSALADLWLLSTFHIRQLSIMYRAAQYLSECPLSVTLPKLGIMVGLELWTVSERSKNYITN